MRRVKVNDPGYYMSGPKRQIACSIAKREDFAALAAVLKAREIDPDEVQLIQGEEGAVIMDRSGEHHGLIANIRRLFPMINNHVIANMSVAEEVLMAGGWALAIPAADEKAADELADILGQHNADNIFWFGKNEMIRYGSAAEIPAE